MSEPDDCLGGQTSFYCPGHFGQVQNHNDKILLWTHKKVFWDRATMLHGDTDYAYLEVLSDDFFAEIKDYV